MSKIESVKEVPYFEYFCDFCGAGPGDRSYVRDCFICERDACPSCSKFYSEFGEEESVKRWCKHCFKFAAKTGVLEKIEEFRLTYTDEVETEMDKLRDYIKKRINT